MLVWRQQGAAVVGALSLLDGRPARIVLVGPRSNPKGAVVALPQANDTGAEVVPLHAAVDVLTPQAIIDTLCTQERVFGTSRLEPPEIAR